MQKKYSKTHEIALKRFYFQNFPGYHAIGPPRGSRPFGVSQEDSRPPPPPQNSKPVRCAYITVQYYSIHHVYSATF